MIVNAAREKKQSRLSWREISGQALRSLTNKMFYTYTYSAFIDRDFGMMPAEDLKVTLNVKSLLIICLKGYV